MIFEPLPVTAICVYFWSRWPNAEARYLSLSLSKALFFDTYFTILRYILFSLVSVLPPFTVPLSPSASSKTKSRNSLPNRRPCSLIVWFFYRLLSSDGEESSPDSRALLFSSLLTYSSKMLNPSSSLGFLPLKLKLKLSFNNRSFLFFFSDSAILNLFILFFICFSLLTAILSINLDLAGFKGD